MNMRNSIVLFGALLSMTQAGLLAAETPCSDIEVADPRLTLVMRHATLNSHGVFVGTFELTNSGFKSSIELPALKRDGAYTVEYPDVIVEFKDLNSNWIPVAMSTGVYGQRLDTFKVAPKATGMFSSTLITQEMASESASDFRILLRLPNQKACFASKPFHAIPVRTSATGLAPR